MVRDEDLENDVKSVAKAYMGMKSGTMFKTFEDNPEVRKVIESLALGTLNKEDVQNPEEIMWTMAIAQIDAAIMQLQSAKELLVHYKNKPT